MTADVLVRPDRRVSRRWFVLGLPAGVAAGILVAIAGPSVVLAALVATVAVAATTVAPGVVFALYLFIPFYKGAVQPFAPVDITVVLAIANALQIIPVLLDRGARRPSWIGIVAWLSVGVLVLGGVLYAPDQPLAVGQAIAYWALVVMPILPAVFRVSADVRYLRELLWTMAVTASAIVVLGLVQISTEHRLVLLGMNTIQVSRVALLVPLLGATLLMGHPRTIVRIAALVLMPPAILVALASGSRGPALVLAVMAAYGALRLVVSPRALTGRRLALVAAAATTAVVVVIVVPSFIPALSLGRFTLLWDFIGAILSGDHPMSSADTSADVRTQLFGLAAAMFRDRPLLGGGTASFEALGPAYGVPPGGYTYPHNALLQFAAEFGIVGVALFVSLVVAALLRPMAAGQIPMSLRALACFFLLNAMLSGNIVQDRMTWALILLLLVIDPQLWRRGEQRVQREIGDP